MNKLTTIERIVAIAKQKNISIKSIADETNIPCATLYTSIKRNTEKISYERVKKIACVLGVTVNELMDEDNENQEYLIEIERLETENEELKVTIKTLLSLYGNKL